MNHGGRLRELVEEQLAVSTRIAGMLKPRDITLNSKQVEIVNHKARELLVSGINQVGKSEAARRYFAMKLSGKYPSWYTGPRWPHPIEAIVCGPDQAWIRDNFIRYMLGPKQERGTGLLSPECFPGGVNRHIVWSQNQRTSDIIELFTVQHFNERGWADGLSRCYIFTHATVIDQGRGFPAHEILLEEEPRHLATHSVLSARTTKTDGYLRYVMSPERGRTQLWRLFEQDQTGYRQIIKYGINDATHLTPEQRESIIAKWRGHPEEAARLHGDPVVDSGLVWNVDWNDLVVESSEPPRNWKRLIGLDLPHTTGTFAAVPLGIDPATQLIYVLDAYRNAGGTRAQNAQHVIRAFQGDKIWCSWPHDGARKEEGFTLYEHFERCGLKMLPEPAAMIGPDGKRSRSKFEAIEIVRQLIEAKQLRIMDRATALIEELRCYSMKAGKIVRSGCDTVDAFLKGIMMLGEAEPLPHSWEAEKRAGQATLDRLAPLDSSYFHARKLKRQWTW